MTFDADLLGEKQVRRNLQRLAKRFPLAFSAAMLQEGYGIDADAVQMTPVDTGRLRGSHYVAPPQRDPQDGVDTVEVGFGTQYGAFVHENVNADFTVGEAEFLRTAVTAAIAGMAARIARRTKQNQKNNVAPRNVPEQAPRRPRG